jgi:hypothetical protein
MNELESRGVNKLKHPHSIHRMDLRIILNFINFKWPKQHEAIRRRHVAINTDRFSSAWIGNDLF